MKAPVLTLYTKSLVLLIPLLLLMISFVVIDPFCIIHKRSGPYQTSDDFISTELYLNNTKHKNYNSFVFGNSKALAFRAENWLPHIKQGLVFKFAVPGESIFNIYNKVKLVLEKGDSIKHALVIIDNAMLSNFRNTSEFLQGPVYKHHPYTQDENWLTFYGDYFGFYLADGFFAEAISRYLSDSKEPKEILDTKDFTKGSKNYDSLSNEFYLGDLEIEICQLGFRGYFEKHFKTNENTGISALRNKVVLNREDAEYLRAIKKMFDSQNADYKIIAGPVWRKEGMPEEICKELRTIFNNETFYDYSKDKRFVYDSTLFYEKAHYRPIAGARILNEVYEDSVTYGKKVCY